MKKIAAFGLVSAIALSLSGQALAATEVNFWHAMSGKLGERVDAIVAAYNAKQSDYKINAIYKGEYEQTMTAAVAGFRAKQHPHIVQVWEVGTATMMGAQGAVYPVHELMAEAGAKFDPKDFLPAVAGYYTTTSGDMLSMPFNTSTPVMFYNKDAFKKAGIDQAPKTWPELVEASKKLIASGASTCGFTTGFPSWVQLENLSAIHDKPFATKANGFGGFDAELTVNGDLQVQHLQNLADWSKDRVFVYGGRRGDANPLFLNGDCAMLMNSSAYYSTFEAGAKFDWAIAELPYYPDQISEPKNSVIGGATLWVLKGHEGDEYKGVADFLNYVSSPEVQAEWHQGTGYVPVTNAAYELSQKQDYYSKAPGADIAILQLTKGTPSDNSKGFRLGNFLQLRDLIEGEMENIFAGKKTAKEGLDYVAAEGNKLLRKFEKAQQ